MMQILGLLLFPLLCYLLSGEMVSCSERAIPAKQKANTSLSSTGEKRMTTIHALSCEHLTEPLGISTATPRFGWKWTCAAPGMSQAAYRIQVSENDSFENCLWDSGDVSSDTQIGVRYAGDKLKIRSRYCWRVYLKTTDGSRSDWSVPAWFETGFFSIDDWDSRWFPCIAPKRDSSANHLRKEFELPTGKSVAWARLYAASTCGVHYEDTFRMNLYQVRLNGSKVGNDLYNPGQLSARKERALYRTHDIGDRLMPGINAVGVVYASARISLQIHILFTDGTSMTVNTGEPGWKWMGKGPFQSLWYRDERSYAYGGRGEIYDARAEFPGWDQPGYDDKDWSCWGEPTDGQADKGMAYQSRIVSSPNILKAQMQSVQTAESIEPVAMTELPDGRQIIDFGRDMNGHEQILLTGKAGDRIVMRFGERLAQDGSVNVTTTWGGAREASTHEDVYIKRSDEPESYAPTFAQHSFRYMEIRGLSRKLSASEVKANVVHSTVLNGSHFSSSDNKAQRLHQMCLRSFLSNLMSVPMDCSGRERQGWLSSGGLPAAGECVSFDMRLFYEKWFDDIADSQSGDGSIPLICPSSTFREHGIDMLQYALLFNIPQEAYMTYGDITFLENIYPTLKGIAGKIRSLPLTDGLSRGNIIWNDWMCETSIDRIYLENTCVCILLDRFAGIADILGHKEDSWICRNTSAMRKEAINRTFRTGESRYGQLNIQTENALALAAGLPAVESRNVVAQALIRDLEDRGYLTCGAFCLGYLLDVLSAAKRNDLIWKLMQSDRPRTFGYWLLPEHNLTGIPEYWDRWDAALQHANHHDFTTFDAWFYRELVGIKPLEPGYKSYSVKPYFPEGVDHAAAKIDSAYGNIIVRWQRVTDGIRLSVTVPSNTKAHVYLNDGQSEAGYGDEDAKEFKIVEFGTHEFHCRGE